GDPPAAAGAAANLPDAQPRRAGLVARADAIRKATEAEDRGGARRRAPRALPLAGVAAARRLPADAGELAGGVSRGAAPLRLLRGGDGGPAGTAGPRLPPPGGQRGGGLDGVPPGRTRERGPGNGDAGAVPGVPGGAVRAGDR